MDVSNYSYSNVGWAVLVKGPQNASKNISHHACSFCSKYSLLKFNLVYKALEMYRWRVEIAWNIVSKTAPVICLNFVQLLYRCLTLRLITIRSFVSMQSATPICMYQKPRIDYRRVSTHVCTSRYFTHIGVGYTLLLILRQHIKTRTRLPLFCRHVICVFLIQHFVVLLKFHRHFPRGSCNGLVLSGNKSLVQSLLTHGAIIS